MRSQASSLRPGSAEDCILIFGGREGGLGVCISSSGSRGVFRFGLSSWLSVPSSISWGSCLVSGVGGSWYIGS